MKHTPVLAVILMASLTLGQDANQNVQHAPTVAQCQADQRLWLSKIESDPNQSTLPPYSVLNKWRGEMLDCADVDPDNKMRYYSTGGEFVDAGMKRLMDFLTRHQLWDKFLEEDAAGKR
jgi:arylsulfatase A-like enzyme